MFITMQVSHEVVRALRPVVAQLLLRDKDLASQIRRAATSAVLNLAEGEKRAGKDQTHHYRIAAGSASEARVALRVADDWGLVDDVDVAAIDQLMDRQAALLHRLIFRQR